MQYGGPGVKLYHSEHNIWNYTKIQPVASFLTELRSKGVRIDGVFFQVCLEAAITRWSACGTVFRFRTT
jgi:GH35 family endo-1,4-beta-xylanase